MAIKLRFTFNNIETINELWYFLDGMCPNTPKQKAMLSAIQEVATRFKRKEIGLMYHYDATSEYSMKLKDHEAYFLEMFIRDYMVLLPKGYTRTIVNKYADIINQKLA